jgi:hypothetical protein
MFLLHLVRLAGPKAEDRKFLEFIQVLKWLRTKMSDDRSYNLIGYFRRMHVNSQWLIPIAFTKTKLRSHKY